jgi:vacuolar-type H+-ATPase subunit F/Vma7
MAKVMRQKKIVVVGSKVLPTGMRLAGVKESHLVQGGEETERLLTQLFERDDVGIIVITEDLEKSIKDRRVRYRMDNSLDPVVLSVPGYGEKMESEDTLRRLILRAVGIDILEKGGAKA